MGFTKFRQENLCTMPGENRYNNKNCFRLGIKKLRIKLKLLFIQRSQHPTYSLATIWADQLLGKDPGPVCFCWADKIFQSYGLGILPL